MLWLMIVALISQALPAENINFKQAYQFAEEAYRAGYPLVLQELIRKELTEGDSRKVQMGQLYFEKSFPTPVQTEIRWTNVDALYALAWADLAEEPYILTIPKFDDRLFLFPIMSAWNEEVFLIRKEGVYALVGPYWKGSLPKNITVIRSPTNNIFMAGKIFSTGTFEDISRVHTLQEAMSLRPLSFAETDHAYVLDDFEKKTQIKNVLSSQAYFTLLAQSLKGNPPPNEEIAKKLSRVGITNGSAFVASSLNPKIAEAMRNVPKTWEKNLGQPQNIIKSMGGWTYSMKEGVYGSDFMRRTLSMALGQAFAHEVVYLFTDQDVTNQKLEGKNRYILHISKEKIPPVKGTWSLTAYDTNGKLFANPLNRYAIKEENPLVYNQDGSLDIFIQNRYPGKRKEENWLPVPEESFSLMLRLYLPEKEVFENNWIMSGIKKEVF